jgi:hypothetical protein
MRERGAYITGTELSHEIEDGAACLSRKTAMSMVFKLMMSAKKKWRKLSGTNRLRYMTSTRTKASQNIN